MNQFKLIQERFKAPTPKFWKKIRTISLSLGGIGVVIMGGSAYYDFVPQWLTDFLLASGLVGYFLSSLTAEVDPEKAIMQKEAEAMYDFKPSEEMLWKSNKDPMYLNYLREQNPSAELKAKIEEVFKKYHHFPTSESSILEENNAGDFGA